MLAHASGPDWKIQAPAKLNLHFQVRARRGDGYHEIETLMVPVSLYDSLTIRRLPPGPTGEAGLLALSVVGSVSPAPTGGVSPAPTDGVSPARTDLASPRSVCPPLDSESPGDHGADVPGGRENLAFRAIDLLRRRAGVRDGAALRLVKRIPPAAGLGGGSSDAAAALVVANAAWGLDWPTEKLVAVAAELGSDVPFFLAGGPAVCRGRGERVERIRSLGRIHFVIAKPPEGLSTARVYAGCEPGQNVESWRPLATALRRGDTARAGRLLTNGLEPAARGLSPWIDRLRGEFGRFEFTGHQMTGSGSGYFGLCRSARHARRAAAGLRARSLGDVFAGTSVP